MELAHDDRLSLPVRGDSFMPIMKIDHVNIRTPRFDETVRFYSDVLNMTAGPAPGSGGGTWIYDERGHAVVHLSVHGVRRMPGDNSARQAAAEGSGVVHHIAFECVDHDAFVARLTKQGVAFERNFTPNVHQVFLRDPNDILIELNFR
jgi:catechol 2,3-dioxygenase-like lactoylglutathione lyase family enzyme